MSKCMSSGRKFSWHISDFWHWISVEVKQFYWNLTGSLARGSDTKLNPILNWQLTLIELFVNISCDVHTISTLRGIDSKALYHAPFVRYFVHFWLLFFTWIHFHWSPNSFSSWLMCFRIVTLLTFYSIYISLGRDLIDPFPKSFPPPRPYISSPQKRDGTVTHWQLTSSGKVQSSRLVNFKLEDGFSEATIISLTPGFKFMPWLVNQNILPPAKHFFLVVTCPKFQTLQTLCFTLLPQQLCQPDQTLDICANKINNTRKYKINKYYFSSEGCFFLSSICVKKK